MSVSIRTMPREYMIASVAAYGKHITCIISMLYTWCDGFFYGFSSRWWSRNERIPFRFRVNSINTSASHRRRTWPMIGEKTVVIPLQQCSCDSQTKSSRVVHTLAIPVFLCPVSIFSVIVSQCCLRTYLCTWLPRKVTWHRMEIWAISGKPASAAAKKKKKEFM